MSDSLTAPLFDESAVRQALERLRQAEPLGDSVLRNLVWVRRQVDEHTPLPAHAAIEFTLWTALIRIIEQNVIRLRRILGLTEDAPTERQGALDALRLDFAQNNAELEAWSALYFRYASRDLNLQVQDIAHALGIDPRQVRRRLGYGMHRLTAELSRLESEARAKHRRLWLHLKLPPPTYSTLFGSEDGLPPLLELLDAQAPPHTIALTGPGGIGKTTLAHAAVTRLVEDDRFSELAWLTLGEPTDYLTLLDALARNLGYLHLSATNADDLEANLRVHLTGSPALIVIDNADYLEDFEGLLSRLDALAAPGRLLLTARREPPPGTPPRLLRVAPLPRGELLKLLRETARTRRIAQARLPDEAGMDSILSAVGGNPLAARLIIGQLRFLPLDRVLDNLSALELPGGDGLFEALYLPTWQSLNDPARRVAMALSLMPADGAYWHDLYAVTLLPREILDRALRELISCSMVDATDEGPRYWLHPLTRRFVAMQGTEPEEEPNYRDLLCATLAYENRAAQPDTEDVGNPAQVVALLHRHMEIGERPDALGALVEQAASAARRSGRWMQWREVLRHIADRLKAGHSALLARTLLELGVAERWLGDSEAALAALDEAVYLFGELGEFAGQAEALLEAGQIFKTLGQTGPAFAAYQRATAFAVRRAAPELHRRALTGLAGLALNNNRPDQALELLGQVLDTFAHEPPDGQTLSLLGMALLRAERIEEALRAQESALEWFREADDLPRLARTHLRLGMACHAAGDTQAALVHLHEGLGLMRALGDALGQARLLTNLGAVYADRDRWREALDTWRDARALQIRLGDRMGLAYTLYNLADLTWRLEHRRAARETLAQARAEAERLGLAGLLERIAAHPLSREGDGWA